MRWFRDTIRQSTWLALIALAINLGLSFGHFHAIDGKASERAIAAMAASISSPDDGRNKGNPNDSHVDYLCPICIAAAAMANALAAASPALPAEFADISIDHAIEHERAIPQPPRAAFQPRGPPVS
jgi:hypothetical protein